MWLLLLAAFVGGIACLIQHQEKSVRDAKALDELYRLEYRHIYPTGY